MLTVQGDRINESLLYTPWPKVFEQQLFVFIHSSFPAQKNLCRCFCMDDYIERYVKFNKIAKFLNLHFYGGVKLIKYIMSYSLIKHIISARYVAIRI